MRGGEEEVGGEEGRKGRREGLLLKKGMGTMKNLRKMKKQP